MSGFAGFTNFIYKRNDTELVIKEMTDAIANRGIDIEAYYDDLYTHIGYRCIRIPNLESRKNAMNLKYNDKEYMIFFDGELYNKDQIIEDEKIKLNTGEYEELLIILYDIYGEKFVEKLAGVFSLVIWNKEEMKLYMARDIYGIKPLFYSLFESNLIYASELKSILKFPNVKAILTTYGIANIFLKGILPIKTRTFLKNIYELNPGEYLTYTTKGINIKKYDAIPIDVVNAPVIKTVDREIFLTKENINSIVKYKDVPNRINEDVMILNTCQKIGDKFSINEIINEEEKWASKFDIRCKLILKDYSKSLKELFNFFKKGKNNLQKDFSSIDRIANRYKYNLVLPKMEHTINKYEIIKIYNEIIENANSNIFAILDRENAKEMKDDIDFDTMTYLIEVNEWLSIYNIIII